MDTPLIDDIDEQILEDLKRDEGFSFAPYRDTEGHLTIGYGTKIERISREEAQYLLDHRLGFTIKELYAAKPVGNMPLEVQRALVNAAYNMGVRGLLRFKRMWAALEEGDYAKAGAELLDSRYARQVGARAQRLAKLISQGGNNDQ